MAVAGGENEFTRWGFRDAITKRAMDIVQPDVCAAGGITECKKIASMAIAHGVECVPHAWGSAIGLAATLQFLASIPDQPPSLFPYPLMLEFEQTENPFRDDLARNPIHQKDGMVVVPIGPCTDFSVALCGPSRPTPGESRLVGKLPKRSLKKQPAMCKVGTRR